MPAGALPASWVQMSQFVAGDPSVLDGADPGTEQEQNGDDTGDGGVDAGSATIVSEELEEDGSLDDDGEAAEAGGVEGGAELAGGLEGGAELTS